MSENAEANRRLNMISSVFPGCGTFTFDTGHIAYHCGLCHFPRPFENKKAKQETSISLYIQILRGIVPSLQTDSLDQLCSKRLYT